MSFHQFQIRPTTFDADAINEAMKKMLGDATLEEIGFNSQAEFHKAIANPKYDAPGAEGEAYRRLVARMVENSQSEWQDVGHNEQAAAKRQADWKTEEDRQILREHIEGLMKDERYQTSALWRRRVREQIAANPDLFEIASPTPTRVSGRIQMTGEDFNAVREGLAKEKKDAREADAKAAGERAARLAAKESFDVTTPFGIGE